MNNEINSMLNEKDVIENMLPKKKRREQTIERKDELELRKMTQLNRVSRSKMQGVSANINRRTNDPHMHTRQKTRRLAQLKK